MNARSHNAARRRNGPPTLSIPVFARTVTLQSAPAIRTLDKTFSLMDWSLYTALVRVHFQGAKSEQYQREISAVETLIEDSIAAVATAFAEDEARWRERLDKTNGKGKRPAAKVKYQRPVERAVELRTPTMEAFLDLVEAQDRISRLVDETWFAHAISAAERMQNSDRLSNRIIRLQRRIRMLTRGLFRRVIGDSRVPEEGYLTLLKEEGAVLTEAVIASNDAALQAEDHPDDEQAFQEALGASEASPIPVLVETRADPIMALLSTASRP